MKSGDGQSSDSGVLHFLSDAASDDSVKIMKLLVKMSTK